MAHELRSIRWWAIQIPFRQGLSERLRNRQRLGGNYSASPLLAGGCLYFFSQAGRTTVLEPGRSYRELAVNQLDDGFMASPAVSGSALILRTTTHLYRIDPPRCLRPAARG